MTLSGCLDQDFCKRVMDKEVGSMCNCAQCKYSVSARQGIVRACEPSMESCTSERWPRHVLQRYVLARSLRALSKEAVFISGACLCRLRNCFADVRLDDAKYSTKQECAHPVSQSQTRASQDTSFMVRSRKSCIRMRVDLKRL